jgi:hypothetical protein
VKKIFRLVHNEARQGAIKAISEAADGLMVTIQYPSRTLDQNSALWPCLAAFSAQLKWPVNGVLTHLSAEEWKDILTAAFRQEHPRLAQGISGGVVMLGHRTSKFDKREFSDFLDFVHSVAADRGIDLRGAA